MVDRGLETVLGFLLAGFLIFLSRGDVYGLGWSGLVLYRVFILPPTWDGLGSEGI